jgi:transcriptional regulator with XRE-family HTH domain
MVLLRKVIGDALRARRQAQHRTLREVSTAANVSLGYLSEIERGHKEASSELLASICDALHTPLSEMLTDVSMTFALAEQMEDAFTSAVHDHEALNAEALNPGALNAEALAGEALSDSAAVTEGDVTVKVRSRDPLRATLITKRVPPGQRFTENVFVG